MSLKVICLDSHSIPMYRATIYIQMSNTLSQADVLQYWAGDIPPRFTHDACSTLDAAYLQANSDQELLDLLPTLLQMHTAGVPVLLVCDEKDRDVSVCFKFFTQALEQIRKITDFDELWTVRFHVFRNSYLY